MDTKSDMLFQTNESWVKSALEKGVSAKVIASLGGGAAEEALAKIRAEEARKGEISEVKDLQIVPKGEFVMPRSMDDNDDEMEMDLDPLVRRNFLKRRKDSDEGARVDIPEKYLRSTRKERVNDENETLKSFQELAGRVQKKQDRI